MSRLLLAETKRLWSRRITYFFPALLGLLMAAGVAIAYFVINGDDSNTPDFVDDIAGGVEATSILGPVASLLPVMAFVIGASYIGADLKSGMVEQILTWEPRRLRFVTARIVAGLVSTAVIAMILAALLVFLLYLLAALVGTVDGTSGELWGNVAAAVGRTGLAAGLFCAFGVAVTLLLDSSVAAITGFVIYWFIVESFLLSTFLPKVAVWLPVTNASSFGSGADVEHIDGSVFSGDFEIVRHHGYLMAGLVLLVWVAVSVVGAGGVFSRRDVA